MSGLLVPPGDHLVRLAAVTPANFGDAGGSATVDRPVALDAWDRLPYLAASALKGVLAGRLGNLGRDGEPVDPRRRALFGGPDTAEAPGRPGSLTFGDGELLAFPLRLRSGARAAVVVGRTLYRLRRLGLAELSGLRPVERPDAYQGEVAPAALPALARWSDFGLSGAALAALAGDLAAGAEPLVAAPGAAEALWRAAVEERTQTALGEGRTVAPGSLRTVELIPAGTVFVSLISNHADRPADLGPARAFQVGAWEAIGCGFLEPAIWTPPAFPERREPPRRPEAGLDARPEHEAMLAAFEAVRSMSERAERAVARSALLDLGPRLRIRGLPGTLAFCLAKAGGQEHRGRRPRLEREAYRWLLHRLLGLGPDATFAEVHRRTAAVIAGVEPPPADLETTWLWLRRYSETLLREKGPA